MTHYWHAHMIVPGGGVSEDGTRWIWCRSDFFLPVRRARACSAASSSTRSARPCAAASSPSSARTPGSSTRKRSPPSSHPETLRMGRLRQATVRRARAGPGLPLALHAPHRDLDPASRRRRRNRGPFKYKDHRLDGDARFKTMTPATAEFIRRFLSHVLPRASIASGTTAFSPMASAPTMSPMPESCSRCQRPSRQPSPSRTAPMIRQSARTRAPVRAAARRCSSSRSSRGERCRVIGRRRS